MTLKGARISEALLIPVIFFSGQFELWYYLPVMAISIEYLNHNKVYLENFNNRLLNKIFIGYVIFICLERGRPFVFNDTIELIINSIEHILFGIIICLKASVYFSISGSHKKLSRHELTAIIFIFNFLSFLNEFFQNLYKHQPAGILNFDSRKDILMNIIGSLIFFLFYKRFLKRMQQQQAV